MTAGRLKDAIKHVEKTLESTQARLEELQAALADNSTSAAEAAPTVDEKGKGKATGLRLTKDSVKSLTKPQIEAEIKDMVEMSNDLKLKVSVVVWMYKSN
jgi:HAT1-interacting factor 1